MAISLVLLLSLSSNSANDQESPLVARIKNRATILLRFSLFRHLPLPLLSLVLLLLRYLLRWVGRCLVEVPGEEGREPGGEGEAEAVQAKARRRAAAKKPPSLKR